jgi:hypothetical protein
LPWLAGKVPLQQILAILVLVFNFAALFAALAAVILREQIGGPSLNTWDEAVAFSGLARFCQHSRQRV